MTSSTIARASLMAALALSTMAMAPAGNGAMRITADATATMSNANPQPVHRSGQLPVDTKINRLSGQWARTTRGGKRAGPGWTNAHAKRVARKARSVKQSRAKSRK
jgi:hypothetical protein